MTALLAQSASERPDWPIERLNQAVARKRVEDHPLPPAVEPDRLLEVLHSREFRNLLTQKWTISTDLLNQHRTMLESTQSVIRILQSEMGEGEG